MPFEGERFMAGVMHTGVRTPGRQIRDAFHHLWTGVLSHLPVRAVARLAAWREILRGGNAAVRMLGFVVDFPLDRVSRDPLFCVRVRHEFLRELRLRKNFRPGWRKACFAASARRFGPLT
jgi:hypothetical protein